MAIATAKKYQFFKVLLKTFILDVGSLGVPDKEVMSHYMIFGKNNCPNTKKAREDFLKQSKSFVYINVDSDPQGLEKMLEYTDGKYMVPVIVNVDEGNVEIGYTGD